jgi:hypothetical protein
MKVKQEEGEEHRKKLLSSMITMNEKHSNQ